MHAPARSPSRLEELPWITSLALGLAVGLAIPAWTGVREVWDHPSYFAVALPVLTLLAALAGWLAPRRAWCVAPAMAAGTCAASLLAHPTVPGLWPLGLACAVLLHLPAFALALAGRRWRLRRGRPRERHPGRDLGR